MPEKDEPMDELLHEQATRLYETYSELARAFQLRDRERTTCFGISISGCHALELLTVRGPQKMTDLAAALFLDNSTVTRLVDRLVDAGLVARVRDPADARSSRARLTSRGRKLIESIRASLIAEQAQVLGALPADSREAVIAAFGLLLDAFRSRQGCPATSSESAATKGQTTSRAPGGRVEKLTA